MATANDLVEATRRHLYAGYRPQRNSLSSGYTAGGTTLNFTYDLAGLVAGSYLSIDLEIFYVWAVDIGAKTATVVGAQLGSTAANHSSGVMVEIDPQFPTFSIFAEINNDLLDLSSPANGLFQIKTVDLTYNAAIQGYDLTSVTDLIGIQEIRFKPSDSSLSYPLIRRYALSRSLPTTDFASGIALILYEYVDSGQVIRVRYRSGFTLFTTLAQDVQTQTGLPATANDLLPLGSAIRLLSGREVKRNFTETQGETRRADEVPAGAVTGSLRGLSALRDRRIIDEATRLSAQWPTYKALE